MEWRSFGGWASFAVLAGLALHLGVQVPLVRKSPGGGWIVLGVLSGRDLGGKSDISDTPRKSLSHCSWPAAPPP
jgi:hypothetical protein